MLEADKPINLRVFEQGFIIKQPDFYPAALL